MTALRFTCGRETWEEQRAAGRYNPGTVARVQLRDRCLRVPIGAGSRDELAAFLEADRVYVVCVNYGMQYAGIEVFDAATGEAVGEMFLQNDYDLAEILGPRGCDLTARTIARRLAEYVE